MACACKNKEMRRRSGTTGFEHVVKLATAFSKTLRKDVEVYIDGLYNGLNLYNFSTLGTTIDKEIVKVIIHSKIH